MVITNFVTTVPSTRLLFRTLHLAQKPCKDPSPNLSTVSLLRTESLSFGSLHLYIVYPSIHILVICSVELDYRNCQILTDYTMNKHQNSKGNSDIYLIFYPLLPLSNYTHRQLNRTLFITQPH